jgi:hypothetical protein
MLPFAIRQFRIEEMPDWRIPMQRWKLVELDSSQEC